MPLVVTCGIPGSGKTTRSKELAEHLQKKYGRKVVQVNEQAIGADKAKSYSNSQEQKIVRGRIKFEVEKNLTGDTVVIVDSLNYIKGYRYQMYCIAREQKTTYCLLYCNTSLQKAIEYNATSPHPFPEDLMDELPKRMEPPQLKNRWDIPLFERREDEPTPVEEMAQALLFEDKKSKDPVSTKQEQHLSEDYLSQVEAMCQQICEEACLARLNLKNTWTPMQAKKIKKDFIVLLREKPMRLNALKQAFLSYLTEADKRR